MAWRGKVLVASGLGILLSGGLGCSGGTVDVPYMEHSGGVEDKAVRSTLLGIDLAQGEACPWIDDRVLLVFSNQARVDPDGPVLLAEGQRIAIGDSFETAPPIELDGGFDCGGNRWERAVQLPDVPMLFSAGPG